MSTNKYLEKIASSAKKTGTTVGAAGGAIAGAIVGKPLANIAYKKTMYWRGLNMAKRQFQRGIVPDVKELSRRLSRVYTNNNSNIVRKITRRSVLGGAAAGAVLGYGLMSGKKKN